MSEEPEMTPGEKIKYLLMNSHWRRRPAPEFGEYLDSLDALDFDIAVYLLVNLKISSEIISQLVPLIDRRCFEPRLQIQIDELLRELEKDGDGNE
jgi:hypothetical protein